MAQTNLDAVARDRDMFAEAQITTREIAIESEKTNHMLLKRTLKGTAQREGRAVRIHLSAEKSKSKSEQRDVQLRLSAAQVQSEREKQDTRLRISRLNAKTERLRLQIIKEVEMARLDAVTLSASKGKRGKPVEQYDLGTNKTIRWFISMAEAALATGASAAGIGDCVIGRQQQAGGFGWRTPGSGEQEGIAAAATAASSRGNTKAKQDGPGNAIE